MSVMGKIRRVFPGGNTSKGFVSFYEHITGNNPVRRFIIKGGPGVGKSTLMNKIAKQILEKGYDVEYHHCSSDNRSIDGVMIPAKGMGIMDGTAPHIVEPHVPGAIDEVVSLSECWDEHKLTKNRDEISDRIKRMSGYFNGAYSLLKEAKIAHDEGRGYVRECLDKPAYNLVVRGLIKEVFAGIHPRFERKPVERHLFASAITPDGLINHVDTLVRPGMKIYTLYGQPGAGVKDAVARLAQAALEWGLDCEQFHCPFEPDQLDMIIMPAINAAVMNVSEPFGYKLSSDSESRIVQRVNFDECIISEDLKKHEEVLADARERVSLLVKKAVSRLSKAKTIHDEIESYYIPAMDFEKVDKIAEAVIRKMVESNFAAK